MEHIKYRTVDQNKINNLLAHLLEARNETNETFATPKKDLPDLNKKFRLDGLDRVEDYYILQMALAKGVMKFSDN